MKFPNGQNEPMTKIEVGAGDRLGRDTRNFSEAIKMFRTLKGVTEWLTAKTRLIAVGVNATSI